MLNKVMLIGRLGKDPEIRQSQSGVTFSTFTLATNTHWNNPDGQRQTKTEWHNVITWGRLAEFCGEFLKKGRLVYLEGRLQTRQWEDQEGRRRQVTEIVAQELQLLEPKPAGEEPLPPDPETSPAGAADTPF